jgi:hypothetical protein
MFRFTYNGTQKDLKRELYKTQRMWLHVSKICINLQNDTFSTRYVTLAVKTLTVILQDI